MRIMVIFGILLVLTGCMTMPEPYQMQAQFNPSEYEQYDKPGTGVITGQAFMRAEDGDVKYAAGLKIYAVPSTAYSDELLLKGIKYNGPLGQLDQRHYDSVSKVIGDAEGNFRFDGLPAGTYWVWTVVEWREKSSYGPFTASGVAVQKVTLADGESKKIILTQ